MNLVVAGQNVGGEEERLIIIIINKIGFKNVRKYFSKITNHISKKPEIRTYENSNVNTLINDKSTYKIGKSENIINLTNNNVFTRNKDLGDIIDTSRGTLSNSKTKYLMLDGKMSTDIYKFQNKNLDPSSLKIINKIDKLNEYSLDKMFGTKITSFNNLHKLEKHDIIKLRMNNFIKEHVSAKLNTDTSINSNIVNRASENQASKTYTKTVSKSETTLSNPVSEPTLSNHVSKSETTLSKINTKNSSKNNKGTVKTRIKRNVKIRADNKESIQTKQTTDTEAENFEVNDKDSSNKQRASKGEIIKSALISGTLIALIVNYELLKNGEYIKYALYVAKDAGTATLNALASDAITNVESLKNIMGETALAGTASVVISIGIGGVCDLKDIYTADKINRDWKRLGKNTGKNAISGVTGFAGAQAGMWAVGPAATAAATVPTFGWILSGGLLAVGAIGGSMGANWATNKVTDKMPLIGGKTEIELRIDKEKADALRTIGQIRKLKDLVAKSNPNIEVTDDIEIFLDIVNEQNDIFDLFPGFRETYNDHINTGSSLTDDQQNIINCITEITETNQLIDAKINSNNVNSNVNSNVNIKSNIEVETKSTTKSNVNVNTDSNANSSSKLSSEAIKINGKDSFRIVLYFPIVVTAMSKTVDGTLISGLKVMLKEIS